MHIRFLSLSLALLARYMPGAGKCSERISRSNASKLAVARDKIVKAQAALAMPGRCMFSRAVTGFEALKRERGPRRAPF